MKKEGNNQTTLRELRELAGLTRSDVHEKYKIPIITQYRWEKEISSCPEYIFLMYAEKLRHEIKWAEIRRVENFRMNDGRICSGYSCYIKGESFDWFFPEENGMISTDTLKRISRMSEDGWKIIYTEEK